MGLDEVGFGATLTALVARLGQHGRSLGAARRPGPPAPRLGHFVTASDQPSHWSTPSTCLACRS